MGEVYKRDKLGRLDYHPDLHPNNGKTWTEDELEYLCKFNETDEIESISLALGRTAKSTNHKLFCLRKSGKYTYYRNLNVHYNPVSD